ncbi:MAG: glycosyltransferase family 4 protein [bacterium]
MTKTSPVANLRGYINNPEIIRKHHMRIAMIGQKGIPTLYGGVERHVEELSSDLAKRGFEVLVYTRPYYTSKFKRWHKGVQLISIPTINTKHLDAITHSFLSTLSAIKHKAGIIHYHGVGPSLVSWIPRLLSPSTKVVATFHCIDRKHEKWGLGARTMLKLGEWTVTHFPHKTISVSKTIKRYCSVRYNRQSLYIPNGVSPTTKQARVNSLRRKFNLTKNKYLLSVTRFVPHKDVHILIKAYQRANINMPLVIVGGSSHTDDYVKKVKQLAQGNPMIIFTEYIAGNQIEELFANAYAFIQPSRAEGLPIVLLEAMRSNCPVLASKIPEHVELINPRKDLTLGYYFRTGDIGDLVDKMNWLISNPQPAKKTGQRASCHVKQTMKWEQIGSKTAELYWELKRQQQVKNISVRDYLEIVKA